MIEKEEEPLELIEKFRLIIENVNDLISIIDQEHPFNIKFINEQTFLNLLDYSNKDLLNKSILDYIHPDDVKKVIKFLKKGTDGGVDLQEIRIRDKNKNYFWFEYKVKKYKDHKNNKKSQQKYLIAESY